MPKKNDETEKTEIVRVRISLEERKRCTKARLAGSRHLDAESSFMGFLVNIGLNKYEKAILPLEMAKDEALVTVPQQVLKKESAEKSHNDKKTALILIDRMKVLMKNNSWGKNILAEHNGNGTELLKSVRAKVIADGYDPDTVLIGSIDQKAI